MKVDIFWDSKEDITKFSLIDEAPAMFGQKLVFIPAGTVSDGASIPKVFWFVCEALNGKFIKAFLKHDYGYLMHISSRKEIDIELREDLLTEGMCPIKAWIIYAAVRIFGGKHY